MAPLPLLFSFTTRLNVPKTWCTVYQIGFNSGDGYRFLNLIGQEKAEYALTGDLSEILAFRIDGMYYNWHAKTSSEIIIFKGSCVTSVLPGEVCSLEAVATECPEFSFVASNCECPGGFQDGETSCIG